MGIRSNNNEELRSEFLLKQEGGTPSKVTLDLDLPLSTIKLWRGNEKVIVAETGTISKY